MSHMSSVISIEENQETSGEKKQPFQQVRGAEKQEALLAKQLLSHRIHRTGISTFTIKIHEMWVNIPYMDPMGGTLPETNSSPLKIGQGTRKETQFSGCEKPGHKFHSWKLNCWGKVFIYLDQGVNTYIYVYRSTIIAYLFLFLFCSPTTPTFRQSEGPLPWIFSNFSTEFCGTSRSRSKTCQRCVTAKSRSLLPCHLRWSVLFFVSSCLACPWGWYMI